MRPTRKAALIVGSLAMAVAALAVALVLSLSPGSGPVSMLSYQGQLSIDGAGHIVRPGRQGYVTAFVYSSAHDPSTLLSATLVPVRGQPSGKLTNTSVYLNHSYDVGGETKTWPPSGDDVRPLKNARIRHGQAGILFGFTGPASGRSYTMAAGVEITYRWHGQVYTVTAWSAGVACGDKLSSNRCTELVNKAQDLTIAQAG